MLLEGIVDGLVRVLMEARVKRRDVDQIRLLFK